MKGWLAVISGHGHDTVDRALQGWRHEAQTLHLTYGMTLLARALLREGRLTEGTATVNEALRWSLEHDQLYLLSELKRLQGELAILGGDREAGIRLLQVALEEATRRGAGWFELKAACSLARHGEPGADELMRTALSAIEGGWEPALVREAKDLKTGTLSKTFGE